MKRYLLCLCVLQEWAVEKRRLTDANAQALEKASTAQLGDTVQIQYYRLLFPVVS